MTDNFKEIGSLFGRKIEALEDLSGLPLAGNCSGLDIDRILHRPKCLG